MGVGGDMGSCVAAVSRRPEPEAYVLCYPICLQHQSGRYTLPPALLPRHILSVGAGMWEG